MFVGLEIAGSLGKMRENQTPYTVACMRQNALKMDFLLKYIVNMCQWNIENYNQKTLTGKNKRSTCKGLKRVYQVSVSIGTVHNPV